MLISGYIFIIQTEILIKFAINSHTTKFFDFFFKIYFNTKPSIITLHNTDSRKATIKCVKWKVPVLKGTRNISPKIPTVVIKNIPIISKA